MGCCGKSKRKVIEVTKKPLTKVQTKTRYLSWYDPMPDRGDIWQYWPAVRRTSNCLFIYLPDLGDLLHKYSVGGWPKIILGGSGEEIDRTADAALTIMGLGYKGILQIFFSDEPDLGAEKIGNRNMTEHLTHQYHALENALRLRGIRERCQLGPMWSVAGPAPSTWRDRFERFGVPPMDFIALDGWYTGSSNELHLVRERNLEFIDYIQERLGVLPKIHCLKVFSHPTMDPEELSPEWVLRQLNLVTGLKKSKYEWTNPNFGDTAEIVLEPLPKKYQGDTVMFFLMDSTARDDVKWAGGNRPDVINAIAEYAKPRGWTME